MAVGAYALSLGIFARRVRLCGGSFFFQLEKCWLFLGAAAVALLGSGSGPFGGPYSDLQTYST